MVHTSVILANGSQISLSRRTFLSMAASLGWGASGVSLRLFAADPQPPEIPVVVCRFKLKPEEESPRTLFAQDLIAAQDGSHLLHSRDGKLWILSAQQIVEIQPDPKPFTPHSPEVVGNLLKTEMGPGFEVQKTKHYVLCGTASPVYLEWCGALLERLYDGFQAFWKRQGLELHEPEFPLPVIVFATQAGYAEFAQPEVGPAVAQVPGYYSITTNRIVLHDLTAGTTGKAPRSPAEVENRLASKQYNVATMVHEATHQLAFNSGLHTRLADNPLWLTEGMAIYFETPDLRNKTGWRTAGILNKNRLQRLREFINSRRTETDFEAMLRDDQRLSQPETAEDAYAEAWGLTYFLIKRRTENYVMYLKHLAKRQPLQLPTPVERLADFEQAFGERAKLEKEFLAFVRTLGR